LRTIRVTKPIPSYLKLLTDSPPALRWTDEDRSPLEAVRAAFRHSTGLTLEYVMADAPSKPNLTWSAPVPPGVGVPPGLVRLLGSDAGASAESVGNSAVLADLAANPAALGDLALSIGNLWQELLITRQALAEREAELAATVPVIEHPEESQRLLARMQAALQSGAETVGCQAAALYLLDDATTELKLRASWNLPKRRLTAPARPLHDQLADLEALLGHAVVLEDPQMFELWRVPESCAACVCLPVSTATIPLGTVWFFADESRTFSDHDTGVLELVAGRIASDLERATLLAEATGNGATASDKLEGVE
jgi:hypothetical protein